jgi:hypothetical protein
VFTARGFGCSYNVAEEEKPITAENKIIGEISSNRESRREPWIAVMGCGGGRVLMHITV